MVKVEFLGPIGREAMEIEVSSMAELSDILSRDEELAGWLGSSAVALNDSMISSLDTKLVDGDRVSILPPVCGG